MAEGFLPDSSPPPPPSHFSPPLVAGMPCLCVFLCPFICLFSFLPLIFPLLLIECKSNEWLQLLQTQPPTIRAPPVFLVATRPANLATKTDSSTPPATSSSFSTSPTTSSSSLTSSSPTTNSSVNTKAPPVFSTDLVYYNR